MTGDENLSKVTKTSWLTPLPVQIRGLLQKEIIRQDDGTKTILRKRTNPTFGKSKNLIPPQNPFLTPVPPVCIPVFVFSVDCAPADNPLTLGVSYTFSIFGLSGTTPYFYQWYLNGSPVDTTATFVHVLVDADVVNKDGSGLGQTFVYVLVSNPCGQAHTDTAAAYPAQGNP